MTTRERLIDIINGMSEEQMQALVIILDPHKTRSDDDELSPDIAKIAGRLHKYADPSKIPYESGVWEQAAVEKYRQFTENYSDDRGA